MPLLGGPAKTALSTAHSQGAESADAANRDGNRCPLGEQIAFQEIVRWGLGNPTRSDCTLWKPLFLHPAISSGSPPTKPCSHAAPRQNQGSPAHQRVPASSSDSHEQSHILSLRGTGTRDRESRSPAHPLTPLLFPRARPSPLCHLVSHRSAHFFPLLLKHRKHGAAKRNIESISKMGLEMS